MYYVYLIKSKKDDLVYTGVTTDLRQRFFDHNHGKSPYTKNHKPYVLAYYESYFSKDDAIHRERSLKLRSKAYAQLRNRIKKSLNES